MFYVEVDVKRARKLELFYGWKMIEGGVIL